MAPDNDDIQSLTNAFLAEVAYDRPETTVSLYGNLIANRFFGKTPDRHRRYISQQSDMVKSGQTVIPIYTAVRGEDGLSKDQLEWYEFTPWEVGGAWLKHYAPMWAYGRKFSNSSSQDDGPEKTLGFNLGTFGSAFGLTAIEVWGEVKNNIDNVLVSQIIEKSLSESTANRATYAEVFNFTLDMPDSPLRKAKTIRLVDAGLAFNLPYPVVSEERPERKSDVLVFFDASKTLEGANQLRLAAEYAQRKGLKFPKINFDELNGKATAFKIFKDDNDLSVPVVIYMTATNGGLSPNYPAGFNLKECTEKSFCTTNTFIATKKNAAILRAAAQANMAAATQQIIDVYRNWIDNHNPAK